MYIVLYQKKSPRCPPEMKPSQKPQPLLIITSLLKLNIITRLRLKNGHLIF